MRRSLPFVARGARRRARLADAPRNARRRAAEVHGRSSSRRPRPTAGSPTAATSTTSAIRRCAASTKTTSPTLKPAWRTHLNGSGTDSKYSGQAQPIVYDGVIYIPTGANDVFALDADTGEILWTHEANLDPNITVICCGWLSRGVAIGEGKVFSGQLDGKLVALDHATGKVVWSIQAETNQDGFSITTAPLYYDGLVITGFAGGDRASRGRVKAYDATTASSSGRSIRSRAPASSATTLGRTITTPGSTAARPSGRRRPSIPSSGSSTSRPATPAPI